jgi:site-specific recombinase XerD
MKIDKLFKIVWDERWNKKGEGNPTSLSNIKSLYQKHVAPAFKDLEVSRIRRSKIRRWHDSFADNIYSGNRALSLLKTLFDHAEKYDLVKLPNGNPAYGIKPHKEKKRDRYASSEELATIKAYLKTDPDQDAANYVRLLMLTGARPKAFEKIKEVKRQPNGFGEATYNGKCGEEKLLFSPDAMKIWKSASQATYKRAFKVWQRLIKAHPELSDMWLRDLRRTFATIALSKGVPLDHIGQLLNHKNPQVTLRYAKLVDQSRNNAMKQITDALNKI